MPAIVVDSSVLISLSAGEQFGLLRELYQTISLPPAVLAEVVARRTGWGVREVTEAVQSGWIVVRHPASLSRVSALPFRLETGELEALALALQLPNSLLIVD